MVSELLNGFDRGGEPLCIQFVNTVGARRSVAPNEYFATASELMAWLISHDLLPEVVQVDEPFRIRSLELRDAIYRIGSKIAMADEPEESDLEALNAELCEALAKLELTGGLAWTLSQADPMERALSLIALSAADLFTSPLRSRLRECADQDCGWLFLDHSKNRSRRWCSMSDCGNLAKARRFLAKKRASGA